MNRTIRYLLAIGAVAALAACGGPTDPGFPEEDEGDNPSDPTDGGSTTSMAEPPAGVTFMAGHLA